MMSKILRNYETVMLLDPKKGRKKIEKKLVLEGFSYFGVTKITDLKVYCFFILQNKIVRCSQTLSQRSKLWFYVLLNNEVYIADKPQTLG